MSDRLRGLSPADAVADLLGLEPLDEEGGRFRRMLHDGSSSAIYYLLGRDDASAMHRLPGPEIWHHYAGAAVRLLTLPADGPALEHRLGDELFLGARPQVVVPGGAWQGAVSVGDWSLVGTTMSPPFAPHEFELGDTAQLTARYPEAAGLLSAIAARAPAVS